MIEVFLDTVDTLEADEERGRLMRVTRNARICGLTSTDWQVLVEAMASVGLASGSPLGDPPYHVLKLVRRRPKLIPGERSKVDVLLEYEREDLRPIWSGDVSAEPVTTMRDRNGDAITLEYAFDEDYEMDPFLAGKTVKVNASVQSSKNMIQRVGEFVLQLADPVAFSNSVANHVNSTPWAGKPARTWKCTRESHRLFDNSTWPPKYKISTTLVHDPDGWDRSVGYTDPNTNEHPPDLLDQSSAHATPEVLPETDFNIVFGP